MSNRYSKCKKCPVCGKLIGNNSSYCRNHVPRTKAWLKKMSDAKGRIFSEETKKKMSLAKKGKCSADKNNNWKGEKCGYFGKHLWIKRNHGNAQFCEHCGKKGENTGRRWNIEWANVSGEYKRDFSDYIGLCKKCHIKFDKKI